MSIWNSISRNGFLGRNGFPGSGFGPTIPRAPCCAKGWGGKGAFHIAGSVKKPFAQQGAGPVVSRRVLGGARTP